MKNNSTNFDATINDISTNNISKRPISSLYKQISRTNSTKNVRVTSVLQSTSSSLTNIQSQMCSKKKVFIPATKIPSDNLVDFNEINLQDRKVIRNLSTRRFYYDKSVNDMIFNKINKSNFDMKFRYNNSLSMEHIKAINPSTNRINQFRKVKGRNSHLRQMESNSRELYQPANPITKLEKTYIQHRKNLSVFQAKINQIIDERSNQQISHFCLGPIIKGFVTKKGNKYKINNSSTLIMKKPNIKENLLKRLLQEKRGTLAFSKAIQSQNITWLWLNKTVLIERFLLCYHDYKNFLEKNKYLSAKAIHELMNLLEMERDDVFVENLILIFDHKQTGTINFKEVILLFILSSNSLYEEKISFLLAILSSNQDQDISIISMIDMLQPVLTHKEYKKMIELLEITLKLSNPLEAKVTFKNVFNALTINEQIKFILVNKMNNYHESASKYEQEISSICMTNIKNYKNYLSDPAAKINCNNIFLKLDYILSSIQNCKTVRKGIERSKQKDSLSQR